MFSDRLLQVFLLVLTGLAFHCAGDPSAAGAALKGRLSLRLANGTPISQPESDEYNPQLLLDGENHVFLVFGSNRFCASSCSGHNLFITRSLTPLSGETLPFFGSPVVLATNGEAWLNQTERIRFAATIESGLVNVYANVGSEQMMYTSEVDAFGVVTPQLIPNEPHAASQIIGVAAPGDRLIVRSENISVYEIAPKGEGQGEQLSALDAALSVTGVRQENSGLQYGYFVAWPGGAFAAAKEWPIGPLLPFDISLAESRLSLVSINSFFAASAAADLVLFTANDGESDDLYVVTSHTARQLWNTTGFFGSDAFLPAMPVADLRLQFEETADNTGSDTLWVASPTDIAYSSDRATGAQSATFNGNSTHIALGARDLGNAFTLATWVKVPAEVDSTVYTVAATATSNANFNGFRLKIQQPNLSVLFETGQGSEQLAVEASLNPGPGNLFAPDEWHHLAVTVNRALGVAIVYVDGLVVTGGPVRNDFPTGLPIRLGSTSNGNLLYRGQMDDAMVFLRELGPLEVLVLASVQGKPR